MATPDQVQKIRSALGQLDPTNDEHWTEDGAPKTEIVQKLSGDATLKRHDIQQARPGFMRPEPVAVEPTPEPVAESTETGVIEVADAQPDGGTTLIEDGGPKDVAEEGEYLTNDQTQMVLDQAVLDAQNAIEIARRKQAEAIREEAAARQALQKAEEQRRSMFPPMTEAEMIQQHLAHSLAERRARVEAARSVGATGVKASRIDQVMSYRRRGQGAPHAGLQGVPQSHGGQVVRPQPAQPRPSMGNPNARQPARSGPAQTGASVRA